MNASSAEGCSSNQQTATDMSKHTRKRSLINASFVISGLDIPGSVRYMNGFTQEKGPLYASIATSALTLHRLARFMNGSIQEKSLMRASIVINLS